jgi:hypothetical protein
VRIRDTFKYFCEICWVMFSLLTSAWAIFMFIVIVGFFNGGPAQTGYWIFSGAIIGLGLMIALISYFEARSHWKYGGRC